MVRAIVGAGGKTSLIKEYAEKFIKQGKKVFVCTSTHMMMEEDTITSNNANEIIQCLEERHYAMAGTGIWEKISGLPYPVYEEVCQYADEVLIEADGSKHMPLKFPNESEPVIYDNVEQIIVVCGLHSLGMTAEHAVHRLELAEKYLQTHVPGTDLAKQTIIKPEHIQLLLRKGYLEALKEKYPKKDIRIKACGGGSLYEKALAGLLEADMDVNLIKKAWFMPQPTLIVCGGGHISAELVKIAAHLDFHIKVIDDRPEFAQADRFPQVDRVICDSFDNLENYFEENAYYVVVTRGHKDDYKCVKNILKTDYQYLGMIGSKTKVAKTFETLRQEGVSESEIQTIHAPIGLDIKAVTPAEIAISILAEIIAEKNQISSSSVSRELLDTQKKGVLSIIIEKKGSSPRGEGSMIYVTEDGIIDSVGGGAVENAVIEQARHISKPEIHEYELNTAKSRNLGMICGGTVKVLFIPMGII